MTIAGYSVQVAGIGVLVTGAALGSQHATGATEAAANALAVGGAVALLAGTVMAASGAPYVYGAPNLSFIETQ